jgi:hypothetical protein
MRWVVFGIFIGHAFAHLPGFLVPFKIHETPEMPHSTRILNGKVDIGEVGIRVVGVLWLLCAIYLAYVGYRAWIFDILWTRWAWPGLAWSLLLSILGLPQSKWGIVVSLFLALATGIGIAMGIFPL